MNKFVFTCGDTNGIGPEIVIKTLNKVYSAPQSKFYFICPKNVFEQVSKVVAPQFEFAFSKSIKEILSSRVTIIDAGNVKFTPGSPTKYSGKASFKAIKLAHKMTAGKLADAMITAPISKTAINMAGYKFPGHTEMLAEWSKAKEFVMMFLSAGMNAALVTIHEPINKVASLITKNTLTSKINIVVNSLIKDLHILQPKIAVLGLNPHAGEQGLIGKEENKIIEPILKSSEYNRFLHGPYSPDAFFANSLYKEYDLVLGMYHDQVLIPFKMLNFSSGVNYTAGLSIVRTSPDHGTAFDIAMQNKAKESSIYEAFLYAERIVRNRKPLIL